MATSSNVQVLHGDEISINKWNFPVTIATSGTIAPGDLITFETSTLDLVDAAGDNSKFLGVSLEYKVSTYDDNATCEVLLRGIVNIGVSSTTYAVGNALKYSAGANGTAWTLAKATSGADGIMWCMEYSASNLTDADCYFDSFLVGTGIGSGTGLWEGFAA